MSVNKPGEVYSDSEVELILEGAWGNGSKMSRRNHALIKVMIDSGIRSFELTALRFCDLDLENFAIRIQHGKGDKTRVVGISRSCLRVLEEWLDFRKEGEHCPNDFIFVTGTGKRILESNLRKMLSRLGIRIKLNHRLHPHGFRHTHARKLVTKNISVKTIQDQLGHANLGTTQRYVAERFPFERTRTIADILD